MAETIVLDPTSVATDRTQLEITPWVAAPEGIDWGDAAIQAYMADNQIGSSAVDYRIPNRSIKIPLKLKDVGGTAFATIRSKLQQKAALFQREGGWVMRQIDGTALYADVENATLHLGGSWYQAYKSFDIDATLELECVPDFYGDEVTLSDHVETTLPHLFFTETNIAGNYPGRVRLIVDNDQATDQHGLLWGFRSRYYDGTATAALFYNAEQMTPANGAAAAALTGAVGGSAVTHSSLPGAVWVPILSTTLTAGSAALTHVGSYRVWARAYSATARPQFRLNWGIGSLSSPVRNDAVQLAGTASFNLLDLGSIRINTLGTGASQWFGSVDVQVASDNDPVALDAIWFQPLDDGAGKLTSLSTSPASSIEKDASPSTAAEDAAIGTLPWTAPTAVTAQDSSYATADFTAANQVTRWLKATQYGYSLGSGSVIKGIQVFATVNQVGLYSMPATGRLVKAGTVQSGAPTTSSYGTPYGSDYLWVGGGPTDLWGGTWTYSDISNSGFGCALSFTLLQPSVSQTIMVNWMQIRVWYTLASGFTVAQDAVIYASSTAELRTEGMFRKGSGTAIYGPVSTVVGDLPRIPPSGLEGRTVQTFLKLSRGNFSTEPDAGIDDLSGQAKYRPSYIFTP